MRVIAEELLANLAGQKSPDVVDGFASPFPVFVIADILGVPRDRFEWLHRTSTEIAGLLDVMRPFDPTSMNQCFDELHAEFTQLIGARRMSPQNDLISALTNDPTSDLSDDDIIALITALMFAGHETTTGLLGNAIVALAANVDQRTLLRERPDLIDNAVEGLLRYDTPGQVAVRTTTAPVRAGAVIIPPGANVGLMIGAANRDLRRWPDANKLRLDRPDPKPISFGNGIHCLGAALTRLEMRVALPEPYSTPLATTRSTRTPPPGSKAPRCAARPTSASTPTQQGSPSPQREPWPLRASIRAPLGSAILMRWPSYEKCR